MSSKVSLEKTIRRSKTTGTNRQSRSHSAVGNGNKVHEDTCKIGYDYCPYATDG